MIGQPDGAHRMRAAPRFKLFQPTEIVASEGSARVHLLNLSTGGALVHASEAPAPGTSLRIRCGGDLLTATVAWARGPKFGLSFVVPLAPAKVERVLSDQRSLVAAASRRLGVVGEAAGQTTT